MAANLFFFASLEARSLSFPCCYQSLYCRFRFPPTPFHTLRLSAVKPQFSHQFVFKCSNSNSADFDILSATECSDGSVIFRFGNASEMAINKAEQSQPTNESAKVGVKVGVKYLENEGISSTVNSADVSNGEPEVAEPVSEKVGRNLKVKSQTQKSPRRNTTRVVDVEKAAFVVSGNEREIENSVDSSKHIYPKDGSVELDNVAQVENTSAPERNGESISETKDTSSTNLNMVLKKDLIRGVEKVSPSLAASAVESEVTTELASSESGSRIEMHSVKLQEENSGSSEGNGENVGKIEGTALNMVSKEDFFPEVEKDSPPSVASAAESEIIASLESGSKREVPRGVKLSEENTGASEGNDKNIGKIEGSGLNMMSEMDLVPQVEEDSPPSAASAVESEMRTELASLESSSESEVPHGVKFQEDNSGAFDGNGETVGKIEGTTLDTESKIDLAVEKVPAQVAASKNIIESAITIKSTSLGDCSNIEVPHSLKFQESGKDDAGEEVAQKSAPSKEHSEEHSINAAKMFVMIEDADEGDNGKVKLNSTLSEVESILNEATVHMIVDESVDSAIVKNSKMLDEDVRFSSSGEEIIEADAKSGNKVRVPMLKGVELQSGGTTLEREEISTAGFFLYSGAALLPNPTKAFAGGEDAYFISCQNWLGVADGVGQWSLEGINVGLYAKELMENCEKIMSDRDGIPITDPVEVLTKAAANTQSGGSSTVLVAYLDDWALNVANIGDSGFMIIRNGAVFKRSSPMVYEFNFPILIERGDYPSDFVEVYRIYLNEGDVIITATDGLFDNLYEKDIASIVLKSLQESLSPQEMAELLATTAQEVGQLSSVRSPFADEAQAAGYGGYRGGKLDDVTVIVSLIKGRFSNHVQ
ncbi:hypothetical protein REPUB_Repub04eG0102500 [Reevesia pubescens]